MDRFGCNKRPLKQIELCKAKTKENILQRRMDEKPKAQVFCEMNYLYKREASKRKAEDIDK